ncbi:uncharacterized protein LOC115461233 isoform X4 [Microcaecilia unicolor]|uniref:Uncharacterized protein LOC115461233 isoform X4 n=1 Tax=Microcaecilia unicolor TaxID=1415580 RepID=A0A6P7WUF5_9AMPH|nr:uncharacterized protein LOC115461233 isoform X4 [Microcaecilia unicolor]
MWLVPLFLLLSTEYWSLASTEEAAAKTSLEIFGRKGSFVKLPGPDDSLDGNGVLEWKMRDRWILTYHYGSNEPEVHHMYESRVQLLLHDGSLLLWNLTEGDGGVYTLQVKLKDIRTITLKILEKWHGYSLGSGIAGLMLAVPCTLCSFLKFYCWPDQGARLLASSLLHAFDAARIPSHISAILGLAFIFHEGRIIVAVSVALSISFVLTLVLCLVPMKYLKSYRPLLKCSGVGKVWNVAGPVVVMFVSGGLVMFNLTYLNLCGIAAYLRLVIGISIAVPVVLIAALTFCYCYRNSEDKIRNSEDQNPEELQSCKVAAKQEGPHSEPSLMEQDGHRNGPRLVEQGGHCNESLLQNHR